MGGEGLPSGRSRRRCKGLIGRRAFLGGTAGLLAATPFARAATPSMPGAGPARHAGFLSIKDLGAHGDGRSHPLSQRFRTLRDARKLYPHVVSLEQETDWAVLQGAIDSLSRTGHGGTVFVPPGRYILDAELVLPNLERWDDDYNEVELRGAGLRSSVLSWPEDLGAGRFALRAGSRTGGPDRNGYQQTKIADIMFHGPRLSDRLAQPPAAMSGLGITSRFVIERVGIYGFRAGVDVWRDHSSLYSCQIAKNYYGVYWSGGTVSFGDHLLVDVDLAGNTFASIAVAPENGIDHSSFIGCHMGFSPFGCHAEEGAPKRPFLSNNKFVDCAFEACGNGWIDGRDAEVYGNSFIGCSYSHLPKYRHPSTPYHGVINVRRLERNLFLGGTAAFGDDFRGIGKAVIVAEEAVGNRFDDGDRLVLGRGPDVPALLVGRTCKSNSFRTQDFSGQFIRVGEGGVEAGDPVQRDYDRVRRVEGDNPAIGVAAGSGPQGAVVPVATEGVVPVGKTEPAIRMGAVLQTGAQTPARVEAAGRDRSRSGSIVGIAAADAGAGEGSVMVELHITLR